MQLCPIKAALLSANSKKCLIISKKNPFNNKKTRCMPTGFLGQKSIKNILEKIILSKSLMMSHLNYNLTRRRTTKALSECNSKR